MNYPVAKVILLLFSLVACQSVFSQDGIKQVLRGFIDLHPAVQSYKAQAESVKREIDSAKWAFYPTPSIGYETADKLPFGLRDKTSQFFRLQQPVWTSGRLTAQLDKAESQYLSAEFSLAEQKLNIAFRWLQLWAEYQAADDKVQIYQDSEAKHLSYVRQIERRAQEGFSAPSDVQLSLSRLSSVQADLRQIQSLKSNAASKLEQMLQKPLDSELKTLSDSGWPLSKNAIKDWTPIIENSQIEEYVNAHPAIQKSQTLIAAAQADVRLVSAKNIPEVYVRSEVRHGDITGTNQTIFFGLNSNFGAGLSNMSAVAAAQAKVEASRNEVATKQMEVREIIQADIQNFQAQFDRLGQLEGTYAANNKYLESSERQYLAGRRSWQEIMNIAREESQILAQIADSKAQIWLMRQRLQILASGLDAYLASSLPVAPQTQN